MTTVTTVELDKWHDPREPITVSAKARLFGELVKLATPILEHYHSDLYHDAMWIDKHVNFTGDDFYYGVDENGTGVGTDPIHLEFRSTLKLHVTVVNHDEVWTMVIVDIT